jgi:NADPH-dependent 2,4-dienoyl-CoA reductase/sulfur reductase-like enzyme
MNWLTEPARQIPVVADKELVVCGGGLTGVMAAVAAARSGASTLLIEANGYLGGVVAMGLPIQGYFDRDGHQIAQGLAQEFVERLWARGGAYHKFIDCELHNAFLIVDPEAAKLVCQEMVGEAGVELYLHTLVTAVHNQEGRLRARCLWTPPAMETWQPGVARRLP